MFRILFWCVTSLKAMFRMKKAYWTERTLTAKMLRKMKNKGRRKRRKDTKRVKKVSGERSKLFARQYDACHLDFQDKRTGRSFACSDQLCDSVCQVCLLVVQVQSALIALFGDAVYVLKNIRRIFLKICSFAQNNESACRRSFG